MTFFQTLLAVLNDQDGVPAILDSSLQADMSGQPVDGQFSPPLIRRLARLQHMTEEQAHMGSSHCASERVQLLECLICETVRDAVPAERNGFRVHYRVNCDFKVVKLPIPVPESDD